MSIQENDVAVLDHDVPGYVGDAWLVKVKDSFYIVSAIHAAFDTRRPETMVFAANSSGEVTNWSELVAIRSFDHQAALDLLVGALA